LASIKVKALDVADKNMKRKEGKSLEEIRNEETKRG
jgi:hypothetical protein